MKTAELSYKMVILFTVMFVLSGVIITGLISPNNDASKNFNAYRELTANVTNSPSPKPEAETKMAPAASDIKPAEMAVVSSQVKDFTPEFDEAWCKANCPAYTGQTIRLSSQDLVIVDEKGNNITNYDELVLKSAPVSTTEKRSVAKHSFSNGFIHVKGIGPMKVNAIAFNYEPVAGE